MTHSWHDLTRLTEGRDFHVERVRLVDSGIVIEGRFELPPINRLSDDDLEFVAAFIQSHGSIKQMEAMFGVSYPTIKNRLNRIGALLPKIVVDFEPDRTEVLARVDRGEITVDEALAILEKGESDE